MSSYLIYGANGYTAALIAREAVRRGQQPILAGRNREAIGALAGELALRQRCFGLDDPAAIDEGLRRGGILTPVTAAWKTRVMDFGTGPIQAMSIPWGDVSTAYYSTRIPDIEVYIAATRGMRWGSRMSRSLGWLLGSSWVQALMK